MSNLRLFRTAVETVQVSAEASARGYWRLRILARRSGEGWSEAEESLFEELSTDEMQDALTGTLEALLGRAEVGSGDGAQ